MNGMRYDDDMELKGTIQNGVAVPDGECSLPEGTKVRISPSNGVHAQAPTIWDKLRELGKKAESRETALPADLADNHDHYLHGRPKRS